MKEENDVVEIDEEFKPLEPKETKTLLPAAESESESGFRKEALKQFQVPDELDLLFLPSTVKNIFAWISAAILLTLGIFWLFFGSLPLTIQGTGVLVNPNSIFNLQAQKPGKIQKVLVNDGDHFQKGQDLIELIDDEPIKSSFEGAVIDVLAHNQDTILPGSTLMILEEKTGHPEWIIYAYLAAEEGKKIKPDDLVEIELSNIRAAEYGGMVGKVVNISPYPVSAESIAKTIQMKGLVNYLMQNNVAVIQLTIEPLRDPTTPTGFKWTSGKGPKTTITPGTVGRVKGIVGHIRPINYLFSS